MKKEKAKQIGLRRSERQREGEGERQQQWPPGHWDGAAQSADGELTGWTGSSRTQTGRSCAKPITPHPSCLLTSTAC
ncbi:hypothetical protein AOLI_G00021590 [Acnodon oligacanthus]